MPQLEIQPFVSFLAVPGALRWSCVSVKELVIRRTGFEEVLTRHFLCYLYRTRE